MEKSRNKSKTLKKEDQKTLLATNMQSKGFLKKISTEEQITLERIKELIHILKTKHHLSTKDIVYLTDDKETLIPVSIFSKKLSTLETITKYLKEELNLSFHQIGTALNRNERNLWHTYANANKKVKTKLSLTFSKYFIPLSLFKNNLSVLENIISYMKEELELSYHNIAVLLERDDRTIWTMYNRAKRKIRKQ